LLFSIHAVRAQPAIPVTQLAEAADGLSQPHDAALSPDGRLLYVTDMRNSRMRVLDSTGRCNRLAESFSGRFVV
jgi:sugar lactone lactonase YvrE